MQLIVLEKGATLAEVACREEAVYIGSGDQCEIRLPGDHIAQQLGVVYAADDDLWMFEPLAQIENIQYNGAPVSSDKVELRSGDQIKIHGFLIRAEPDDRPAAAPVETKKASRSGVASMARFVQYRMPPGTVLKKTSDEVTLRPEHLAAIGQANVLLGQCNTIEELMDRGLTILLDNLGAHRAWLGIRRMTYGSLEYVEGRITTGQMADLPEIGNNLKPRVLDRDQFAVLPYGDDSYPVSVLAGPLRAGEGTLGMAFVDVGETGRRYDTTDLDFFIALLSAITAQLDAIVQQNVKTRDAILAGEVMVAHAIQARLTPRKLPQWDDLQFGAFREMGRERTSDFYDVLRLNNNMALFMIAHTSTGGPIPSMLMSQAHAAFRIAAMHMDAPHIQLRSLNNILYDGNTDHPLDCFIGVVEPWTGNMRFAQAGKTGAYIISARGEERPLAAKTPLPALGMQKNPEYVQQPEKIQPGETLVLHTPGVVTARNSKGEIFGEERFVNILCDGFGQQASSMLREMLSDLQQFTESGSQPDDITVILAHRP